VCIFGIRVVEIKLIPHIVLLIILALGTTEKPSTAGGKHSFTATFRSVSKCSIMSERSSLI
jgi:hypothetical protein